VDAEKTVRDKWRQLKATMGERARRLWAGAEAGALGYGGVAAVARATGLAISTVRKGRDEARAGARPDDVVRVRRSTGKRPYEVAHPEVWPALEKLVDPVTRGDPESPLRWTCKSTHVLAAEMFTRFGIRLCDKTVAKLLRDHKYSLQAPNKAVEGKQHPDRNAQFEHINAKVIAAQAAGQPVISVDTKKKELVGNFKNAGSDYRPKGNPRRVNVHDFEDKELGKVVPYGVYDVTANAGFVSVGITSDTAEFAVQAIRCWRERMGRERYPQASELTITADCGGSNGARVRLWKVELQRLADETGLTLHVHHYPPGTSKWNRIEHPLFCHISQNWRGRPLTDRVAVVELIGATTTKSGLKVECALDTRIYQKGIKVSDAEMVDLDITGDPFHPEWNYTIKPRSS
jgi:hypothetical protein